MKKKHLPSFMVGQGERDKYLVCVRFVVGVTVFYLAASLWVGMRIEETYVKVWALFCMLGCLYLGVASNTATRWKARFEGQQIIEGTWRPLPLTFCGEQMTITLDKDKVTVMWMSWEKEQQLFYEDICSIERGWPYGSVQHHPYSFFLRCAEPGTRDLFMSLFEFTDEEHLLLIAHVVEQCPNVHLDRFTRKFAKNAALFFAKSKSQFLRDSEPTPTPSRC